MSRDASNQAKQTYKESNNLENNSLSNANSLYNTLDPAFTNEAVNPQGFGAKDKADMTTAAEQSAGGALGSAVGKAAQYGAANRNLGSFAPSLDEASRGASRDLGNKTLAINNEDAMLKQNQRQEGLSGLMGLDSQQNNDVLSSLGLNVNATNALTNAAPGWMQTIPGLIKGFGVGVPGSGS